MQRYDAQRKDSIPFCKTIRPIPLLRVLLLCGMAITLHPEMSDAQEITSKHRATETSQITYVKMSKRVKKEKVHILAKGSSSTEARKAAVAALPLNKLNQKQQAQVKKILSNSGMFRKLPTMQFQIQPEVYHYFADHPDVACSIWRVMKISEIEMYQTGASHYEVDMKDGTVGKVTVLQQSQTSRLILCDGKFKSPFLTNLMTATALVHLQTKEIKNKQGKDVIIHRASLFVSFPSQTVETAAKLISPISNMMVDRNFHEVSLFSQMMSLAMQRQPAWVEKTANNMKGVLKERKPELIKLTTRVYRNHRKERLSQAGTSKVEFDRTTQPTQQASASNEK